MSEENTLLSEKTEILLNVVRRYDHYVAAANFKASLMMSFLAAIAIAMIARVALPAPSCKDFNYIGCAATVMVALTIISSLYVAIKLLLVVFPNTKNDGGDDSLIFFGAVAANYRNPNQYFNKIISVNSDDITRDLATQAYNMAEVVKQKTDILKGAVNSIKYTVIPSLFLSVFLLVIEG